MALRGRARPGRAISDARSRVHGVRRGSPADLKLRGTTTKYIFKQAVRGLLPAEIIDRPKKGFSVPLERWFRNELRELSGDLLLDGRLSCARLLQARAPSGGCSRSIGAALRSWHNQLWSLLMLESWHRMFIDERPSAAPSAPLRWPSESE